jgi:hypothetical protein
LRLTVVRAPPGDSAQFVAQILPRIDAAATQPASATHQRSSRLETGLWRDEQRDAGPNRQADE